MSSQGGRLREVVAYVNLEDIWSKFVPNTVRQFVHCSFRKLLIVVERRVDRNQMAMI